MVQFGGALFRTEGLSLVEWVAIIGGTSVVLWVGEIWRAFRRASTPGTDVQLGAKASEP
jgi:Ca2+-transporting ATPase